MKTFGVIGLGKMGQSILTVIDSSPGLRSSPFARIGPGDMDALSSCDAVIEFTTPDAAPEVISTCLNARVPLVSGTTGWHEYHLESIRKLVHDTHGKMLYATNFSIGMNILFAINEKLAAVMNRYPDFKPSLSETHHIHKKDAPSGTAYTLIEGILKHSQHLKGFELNPGDDFDQADRMPVQAIREGEVKGIHEVSWRSANEEICFRHDAFDRKIFAEGAVQAAQWLIEQKAGMYTMQDLIHL